MAAAICAAACAAALLAPRSSRLSCGSGATSSLTRLCCGQTIALRSACTLRSTDAPAALASGWDAARSAIAGGDHGNHAGESHSRLSDASSSTHAMARVSGSFAFSTIRHHASFLAFDPRTLQNARPSPPPSGSAASSARSSSLIAPMVASGVSTGEPTGAGGFQPFASAGGSGTAFTFLMGAIAFCALSSSSSASGSCISTSAPSAPSGLTSGLTGSSFTSTGAAPNRRSSSLQSVPSRKPRLLSRLARSSNSLSAPSYIPHGFSSGSVAFSSRWDPSWC
mmetsp:Transcript_6641/g.27607  ORF Transcript_6641/g.27607 Transcript_6641/m.27607 type:complete len:281 (+) Transcript_6641:1044-1886(+)